METEVVVSLLAQAHTQLDSMAWQRALAFGRAVTATVTASSPSPCEPVRPRAAELSVTHPMQILASSHTHTHRQTTPST